MLKKSHRRSYWLSNSTNNLLLTYFSECAKYSDCPNGGQNYECISDVCACTSGHVLDGDACVGMLSNSNFYITSESIELWFVTVCKS